MQIQEYIYYALTLHAVVFTSLRMSVLTHSRSSYSLVASLDAAKNCQPLNITHFFYAALPYWYTCFYTLVHWNRSTILAFSPFIPRLVDGVRAISKDLHSYHQQHYYTYMADVAPNASFLSVLSLLAMVGIHFLSSPFSQYPQERHTPFIYLGFLCLAPESIVIVFKSKSKRNCCISDLTWHQACGSR